VTLLEIIPRRFLTLTFQIFVVSYPVLSGILYYKFACIINYYVLGLGYLKIR